MSGLTQLILALALGCAGTAVATPILRRLARRLGFLDRPAGYKAHALPTPLLGGVAVAVGFGVAALATVGGTEGGDLSELLALAVGATIILVAGLVDDARGLSAGQKLAWQGLAAGGAGLALALLGVRVNLFLGWAPLPLVLLTVIWVVGITNAVNMMDNMNGLCAGLGAIAAACLAAFNLRTGELEVALAAGALAGACLGFLLFNWPRASIFLGDTGSMLIGFSLASLSVMGVYAPGAELPVLAVLAPLMILALPILDLLAVVALRLRHGRPVWVGDRCHISHRLVARGMAPPTAVATLWAAMLGCGVAALLLPTVGVAEAPLLLLLVASMLLAVFGAAGRRGLA